MENNNKSSPYFRLRKLEKLRKSNNDFNIQITIKNKDIPNDYKNTHILGINLTLEMLLKQREIYIEKLDDPTTMEISVILDGIDYIENQILKLILFNNGTSTNE